MKQRPKIKLKAHMKHLNLGEWRALGEHECASKLYKWHDLIDEHKDELAELITKEGGTEGIEPYLETKYLSIGHM